MLEEEWTTIKQSMPRDKGGTDKVCLNLFPFYSRENINITCPGSTFILTRVIWAVKSSLKGDEIKRTCLEAVLA